MNSLRSKHKREGKGGRWEVQGGGGGGGKKNGRRYMKEKIDVNQHSMTLSE